MQLIEIYHQCTKLCNPSHRLPNPWRTEESAESSIALPKRNISVHRQAQLCLKCVPLNPRFLYFSPAFRAEISRMHSKTRHTSMKACFYTIVQGRGKIIREFHTFHHICAIWHGKPFELKCGSLRKVEIAESNYVGIVLYENQLLQPFQRACRLPKVAITSV